MVIIAVGHIPHFRRKREVEILLQEKHEKLKRWQRRGKVSVIIWDAALKVECLPD